MEHARANRATNHNNTSRFLLVAMLLIALLGIGFYAREAIKALQPTGEKTRLISHQTLEDRYGLRVSLLAVTAAGGMVDVRLQITDGDKAQALLNDRKNFPSLVVGKDVVLRASDDMVQQEIKFEQGAGIFALFPNARNVVKPGLPVSIVFGDLRLEPVPAK
jgi:hypothetical protein